MSKIRGVGGGGDAAGGHHSAGGNPHQVSGNSASSGGISGADRGTATSPVRHNPLTYQHGHSFIKKTFHKPTINCHFCAELLWGLMGQGYICEGKNPTFTFSYFSTFSCQKITFIFPFARQLFFLAFFSPFARNLLRTQLWKGAKTFRFSFFCERREKREKKALSYN